MHHKAKSQHARSEWQCVSGNVDLDSKRMLRSYVKQAKMLRIGDRFLEVYQLACLIDGLNEDEAINVVYENGDDVRDDDQGDTNL